MPIYTKTFALGSKLTAAQAGENGIHSLAINISTFPKMKIVKKFTGMIIIFNANKPKNEPNIRVNQDDD